MAGEKQTERIKLAMESDEMDEEKNAFRMKERLACTSAFSEKQNDKAISKMKEYCPKEKKPASKCPASRRPSNGKCQDKDQ
eukprot:gene17525-23843_t